MDFLCLKTTYRFAKTNCFFYESVCVCCVRVDCGAGYGDQYVLL